jgi:hypothetical protein
MISFIQKNNKLNEVKNNLVITYPRTVDIIYGHYPYPDIIHNFILNIKNNLNVEMANHTNVKGGMTSWTHFLDNDNFKNFTIHLINTHQTTNPKIFQYFLERNYVSEAWGNEIKKGDSLKYHTHPCKHGILYLTKGCDLELPELNIKITPEPGDYYIFPPEILHGFDEYQGDKNRYSLIFNINQTDGSFKLDEKLNYLETMRNKK